MIYLEYYIILNSRPRPSPTNPQQYPVRSSESPAGPRPRKNAYGDEWDDKVQ